jgi:hypothetical protein
MNLIRLLSYLSERNADTRAIYTGTGNPEGRYAILCLQDQWNVYYTERQDKLQHQQFADEEAACTYLLGLLIRDHTVWLAGGCQEAEAPRVIGTWRLDRDG